MLSCPHWGGSLKSPWQHADSSWSRPRRRRRRRCCFFFFFFFSFLLREDALSSPADIYLVLFSVCVNVSCRCASSDRANVFHFHRPSAVCVGKLRLPPVLHADTHPSSILCLHAPPYEDRSQILKVMFENPPPEISYFWSSFCPFLPLLRKKWRSSSGSDVAVLICIQHKLANGRPLRLKTE